MFITIYKQYKSGQLNPVANIELANGNITVKGSEEQIMKVVHVSLDFPTKKKVLIGSATVKKEPETFEENLFLTLKQNVTKPYFITQKNEPISIVKNIRVYPQDILIGGNKERRVRTADVS